MLRRLVQPVLALSRSLRQIRYYSASRQRTGWDTAIDVALMATLFLAIGAVMLAQMSMERESLAYDLDGGVYGLSDGTMLAHINLPDRSRTVTGARLLAAFDFDVMRIRQGWPFASRVITATPEVSVTPTALGRATNVGASLEPGTGIREAIEADMRQMELDGAIQLWSRSEDDATFRPMAWVANWITWWLILLITCVLAIRLLQFTTALYWVGQGFRYRERWRQGRCVHCGYDLRGLEFNDRCPECGELAE